jgi:K+-sensing histidine kinase KdpD
MKRICSSFSLELLVHCLLAVLMVVATTVVLLLIGRDTLGEAVIALLYLVPVGWIATRWEHGPGIVAAVGAALAFDFFFIPPFHTFAVGQLEGWLVLVIFLVVAVVIVGRVQSVLSKAQTSERDAKFMSELLMYEVSGSLASLRTPEAVAHALAWQLRQMFHTSLVKVVIQPEGQSAGLTVCEPHDGVGQGRPDRVLPIWNAWGQIGEIQLWRGYGELPPKESRLLQTFASQATQAFERTRQAEAEQRTKALTPAVNTR